ncbi:hypothetical protein KY332_03805 [Candidatus Woesearchaeota archaeon]|nr:hypothetical protein [Candidatus Woesearchaeota archaeon]
MVLGVDKLLEMVKEKKLVENLCDRELDNPEGAGFDLRISELYKVVGDGFLGIEERKTPEMELVAKFEEGKKTEVVIKPGEYYVLQTMEKVNLPKDMIGLFRPRATLFRFGVTLFTGKVDPGYCGPLNFGIMNNGNTDFRLEMGARIAFAIFHKVDGKTGLYRGQWQGGRVTTEAKEKQV